MTDTHNPETLKCLAETHKPSDTLSDYISPDRLEQMEAHAEEGGRFPSPNSTILELIRHIQAREAHFREVTEMVNSGEISLDSVRYALIKDLEAVKTTFEKHPIKHASMAMVNNCVVDECIRIVSRYADALKTSSSPVREAQPSGEIPVLTRDDFMRFVIHVNGELGDFTRINQYAADRLYEMFETFFGHPKQEAQPAGEIPLSGKTTKPFKQPVACKHGGFLTFNLPEGSQITCECIGEPFIGQILDALRAPKREIVDDKWQRVKTAPYDKAVLVCTGNGYVFPAILRAGLSLNEKGEQVDQWVAEEEGFHPPCWSAGACWETNENDMSSEPPVWWRPIVNRIEDGSAS